MCAAARASSRHGGSRTTTSMRCARSIPPGRANDTTTAAAEQARTQGGCVASATRGRADASIPLLGLTVALGAWSGNACAADAALVMVGYGRPVRLVFVLVILQLASCMPAQRTSDSEGHALARVALDVLGSAVNALIVEHLSRA